MGKDFISGELAEGGIVDGPAFACEDESGALGIAQFDVAELLEPDNIRFDEEMVEEKA